MIVLYHFSHLKSSRTQTQKLPFRVFLLYPLILLGFLTPKPKTQKSGVILAPTLGTGHTL